MELKKLEICGKFTKELDNCDIMGQVFCATQVLDEVQAVHGKIVDTLSSLSKLSLKEQPPTSCHLPAAAGEKRTQMFLLLERWKTRRNNNEEEQEDVPLAVKKPKR
eukprot:8855080-Ditylum_brightwellii.AAC.1